MLDRLHTTVTELNLTDEQKPKIEAIFTQAKDDLQKAASGGWRSSTAGTRREDARLRAEASDGHQSRLNRRTKKPPSTRNLPTPKPSAARARAVVKVKADRRGGCAKRLPRSI